MTAKVDPIPKEARTYQGRRAGFVTRIASTVIDVAGVVVFLTVVYLGLSVALFLYSPNKFDWPALPLGVDLVIGYVSLVLYWAAAWSTGGRTYGCHVMGLRLVDGHGELMHPLTALVRAGFCVIFPVGFVWVLFSKSNRSLQDIFLRTSVIYDWDVRPRTH